ncbi:RNA dependent RNA polymerase-domain-containing protein [Podospora conica]|nr:RNA dependent RNA polymerase-domain-containing protein [Schizothecium conicum]
MPPQSRPFVAPPSVAPVTPRKANEIRSVLRKLNHEFNMGVEMPDETMSPAERANRATQDPEYARWVKIYTSLRFLFYFKEGNLLERALDDFDREARALSQTWLTSDQLGSRHRLDLPCAETAGQQLSLQNLLLDTLDKFRTATTPSVSKFSDRLLASTTTSPRKSTSFVTNTTSFSNGPSSLNRMVTTSGNPNPGPPAAFHPTSPSKRNAMKIEEDSTSPTDHRFSPKKHKGRQFPPMDEPVPFNLPMDTRTPRHLPAGVPVVQVHTARIPPHNPFDTVPARQRVAASEIQDFGDPADPLGRTINTMADAMRYQTAHPFDGIRPTDSNNRTREWVANIDPGIVPSDSVSGIGARMGHHYPPSQFTSSPQFSLPIRSQPIPQQQLELDVEQQPPLHVNHPEPPQHQLPVYADEFTTMSDNISEASFHSATNSVAMMNPVAVSHPVAPPAPQGQVTAFPPPVVLKRPTASTATKQNGPGSSAPTSSPQLTVQDRLDLVWPKVPHWLEKAPLAIIWEVTRIGLHCKVDLESLDIRYNPAWAKEGIKAIWADFRKFDEDVNDEDRLFKSFPERPTPEAFAVALTTFATTDSAVVMSANLDWNLTPKGPLLHLSMRPLRLEQGCRLTRRFGADRFFEILTPSPTGAGTNVPPCMKDPKNSSLVIDWLMKTKHEFVGRTWQAFYTRSGGARKPNREYRLEPDAKPIYKERVNFFAESGHTFAGPRPASWVPPADEPLNKRCQFKASQMLDWLLCIKDNQDQPYLKLFSRIQLGLSQTTPVMVFELGQLCHRQEDILSEAGKVMNDGIGRMSIAVARKVRDRLGLTDIPSAIQARIGSAKGMWLVDVNDTGDGLWVETYPSQRKWRCDQTDEHQRTLEVRATSTELRSAGLNLQLLPVLEAQSPNPALMRAAISKRLTHDLEEQFRGQQEAFNDPILLRQWMAANFNGRASRVKNGCVPMLGGLPESKEESVLLLLNSNFVPSEQAYMAKIIWDLQKQKCEQLKTKLNVKVSQSAYVYMVVDFWGVLQEGEVHLGFSNKFQAEGSDESLTLLTNRDVLVTRSPAHFPSDIQKVRAVFKSELASLKDVIVFSAMGDVPLADMLSGGDYDGDQAWVCWDREIVDSFQNSPVPEQPDLSKYMKKDKTTFEDLTRKNRGASMELRRELALYDMIGNAFHFSMQQDYLGICTNFKEKACYWRGNVTDKVALTLSTLVGQLVDQSKQGITFDGECWDRLRADLRVKFYNDPRYKSETWKGNGAPQHIIDHLKFSVAIPVIAQNLTQLNNLIRKSKEAEANPAAAAEGGSGHYVYDRDLVKLSNHHDELCRVSKSHAAHLGELSKALHALRDQWKVVMAASGQTDYVACVRKLHEEYRAITLHSVVAAGARAAGTRFAVDHKTAAFFGPPLPAHDWCADPERYSPWALLKASRLFKLFYRHNGNFIFQMAGEQLAHLKALATVRPDSGLAPLVAPLMWAGTGCDQRFAKQWTARTRGDEVTEYFGEGGGAAEVGRREAFGVRDDGWKEDDDW